jgi:hypothetical protein
MIFLPLIFKIFRIPLIKEKNKRNAENQHENENRANQEFKTFYVKYNQKH